MTRPTFRAAVAVVLATTLLLPVGATAQNNTPTLAPGLWEGSILFSGMREATGIGFDGKDFKSVAAVTANGTTFQILVDDRGEIIEGLMEVDISWEDNATGTTPETNDRYDILHKHQLTGSLTMSGPAIRIVAGGTLTWDTQTFSTDGSLVEEVSGPEPEDVEWVFGASQADCTTINGSLIETNGTTLMATTLSPEVVFDGEDESHHNLSSVLWAWPQTSDPEVIAAAVTEVTTAAETILAGVPSVNELLQLVLAVEAVRAELARLDTCQLVPPGSLPQSIHTWLATILNQALNKALDLGEFTPQELISFLNIGVRAEAIDDELYQRFEAALGQALFDAISAEDVASIWDIAIAAKQYGYPELHKNAVAAAEELGGDPP